MKMKMIFIMMMNRRMMMAMMTVIVHVVTMFNIRKECAR